MVIRSVYDLFFLKIFGENIFHISCRQLNGGGVFSAVSGTSLIDKGITPCIPPRQNRKIQTDYDKALYKQRHKVKNMFAKLKDWRRIHTRHDRCAYTFFSAILIAATVAFWINQ